MNIKEFIKNKADFIKELREKYGYGDELVIIKDTRKNTYYIGTWGKAKNKKIWSFCIPFDFGRWLYSFDKKNIFYFYSEFKDQLTDEEKKIFYKESHIDKSLLESYLGLDEKRTQPLKPKYRVITYDLDGNEIEP